MKTNYKNPFCGLIINGKESNAGEGMPHFVPSMVIKNRANQFSKLCLFS